MATWIINIVAGANPEDPATFVPQLQKPGPNGEAFASEGDLVNWFNNTGTPHKPEATDSTFQIPANAPRGSGFYLSDKVSPGKSSRPAWTVVAPAPPPPPAPALPKVVFYRCKFHPEEHGMIIIT